MLSIPKMNNTNFGSDLFPKSLWHLTELIVLCYNGSFSSADFFDVILALWQSLNTNFAFIFLLSLFAVSFSSHHTTDFSSQITTLPYTVCFYPILTIQDVAAFYCFMQMTPSSTVLLPDFATKLQLHISNCLLDIIICMFYSFLQLKISPTRFITFLHSTTHYA